MKNPTYKEWKKHVLGIKRITYAPIDDFELYQSALSIVFWRIRFRFRLWDPFHFRFLFITNARLKYAYKNEASFSPAQITITIGKWRNVRYGR